MIRIPVVFNLRWGQVPRMGRSIECPVTGDHAAHQFADLVALCPVHGLVLLVGKRVKRR